MVALAGAGNDAQNWQAWGGLDELRPACWGPPGRVVVVVAHGGDAVLGLGGTLQTLVAAGHEVDIIWLGCEHENGARGLDVLGVTVRADTTLTEVGPDPDGTVSALAKRLVGASWCVAPWRHDGEPAREWAGVVAAGAAASVGVPLAEYLVQAWEWALPGDERVPWSEARRSAFDHRVLARKELALSAATGRLSPKVKAELLRPFEVVLQPPAAEPTLRGDDRLAG
jgi:hypothetical protein